MIRLAHFTRFLGMAGVERMIWELCRHRDRSRYQVAVASYQDEGAGEALRAAGARLILGEDALARAAGWADLINFHMCEYRYVEELLPVVAGLGRPWVASLHDRISFPPYPAVVICTAENNRELQMPWVRCVTIPNGVDLERFFTPERPARPEVVITRVCRPPKCAPYFWEVVGRVLERYPQARFRIVGNERPCEHPSGRVEFLGVAPDTAPALAGSDIFFYTPCPNVGAKDLVVLEASASGLPCVVSDVSVVRESVWEGVNGFLTPFGDVEAAAAALGRLIEDRELRSRMGAESRRLACEHADIRAVARRYEAAYEGVLEAHRRREGQPV